MSNIAVLGIGNILMKDDGVAIEVIKGLEKMTWPENLTLIDGGTAILSLLDVFINNDKIIVIDALQGGYDPGTIYRLTPEQFGKWRSESLSLHDVQVLDVLRMVSLFNSFPEVIIFGIEPFELDMHLGLSEQMEKLLPRLTDCVIKELKVWIAQAEEIGESCRA